MNDDTSLATALQFVDTNWVTLWHRINAGGLVQHQMELARILEEYRKHHAREQRRHPKTKYYAIIGKRTKQKIGYCTSRGLSDVDPSEGTTVEITKAEYDLQAL